MTILVLVSGSDLSPQLVGNGLHSIADTEYREVLLIHVRGRKWGVLRVHTCRATGEYESLWIEGFHFLPWRVMRENLTVHMALTDSTCNKHAVLRAKVENDDGFLAADSGCLFGDLFLTLQRLGDAEICGYLDVIAGRDSVGLRV